MTRKLLTATAIALLVGSAPLATTGTAYAKGAAQTHASAHRAGTSHAAAGSHHGGNGKTAADGKSGGRFGGGSGGNGFNPAGTILGLVGGLLGQR
jgi:hypothetical protein